MEQRTKGTCRPISGSLRRWGKMKPFSGESWSSIGESPKASSQLHVQEAEQRSLTPHKSGRSQICCINAHLRPSWGWYTFPHPVRCHLKRGGWGLKLSNTEHFPRNIESFKIFNILPLLVCSFFHRYFFSEKKYSKQLKSRFYHAPLSFNSLKFIPKKGIFSYDHSIVIKFRKFYINTLA